MPKLPPKRYALDQSPLFRLRGKGQLEKVLGLSWDQTTALISGQHYRVWESMRGSKPREIQQPLGHLQELHRRIGQLLSRIELPDYVYSCKGRSYADNARVHLDQVPLIKTDIHHFYPSTSRAMVYRMFRDRFQCAPDIAGHLADLCCYRQEHVPTGSPLSGALAFFAAKPMFDKIEKLAEQEGCRMTLYVDDVTVSGSLATKRLLGSVRQVVHEHGLKTKQKKSKTYSANAPKAVTGAIVASDGLRLPNKRHRKIWETRRELAAASGEEREHLQKVLQGRLQEAAQIVAA